METSLKCRRVDLSTARSVEGDAEWKMYNAGRMRAHFLAKLGTAFEVIYGDLQTGNQTVTVTF
jgi:hypothetical protein